MISNAVMFALMMASGILTNMNVFTSDWHDIGWSLNDVYMASLMTGLGFLFMGLYAMDRPQIMIGIVTTLLAITLIRTQFLIGEKEYLSGMIPHHSMAVFTSQKLLSKGGCINSDVRELANSIITNQKNEIIRMKQDLNKSLDCCP